MATLFYTQRDYEWTEQVRRYGVTISRGDVEATVIRTPDQVTEAMEGNNYVRRVESIVDMLRSDYEAMGMGINLDFIAGPSTAPVTYRVAEIIGDDESEPTIQLRTVKLQ